MNKALKLLLVALLTLCGSTISGVVRGDVSCQPTTGTSCSNAEDGDNESGTSQGGESASGDAVAGQVTGVVSSGDASVDSTNRSEDVDVSSGDTSASNETANFTGQEFVNEGGSINVGVADVIGEGNAILGNAQDGDNSSDVSQASEAFSGDAVGGAVIGVVTSAGGSADVVAANTSEDVDIETGDADSTNDLAGLVGQTLVDNIAVGGADVIAGDADNAQDGDNDLGADQSATSSSGDGVGGQVLGVVSAGDASVDATNESTDVDLETGDADASNDLANVVGQTVGTLDVSAADIVLERSATNAQDGDNSSEAAQSAGASTGDAVGGSVIGVVTSTGGSADVVAANTSDDVGIDTGDADAANDLASVVGQLSGPDAAVTADVIGEEITNTQVGDNDLSADQSAVASSGDGVGGQVLGVVSAGNASVDATNNSEDVDLSTGDGDASNDFAAFVGQANTFPSGDLNVSAGDVLIGSGTNAQDGDNEKDLSQDAVASTGDAVGGQVAGVVTSAGGSADLVLANTSEDVDGETGDSTFENLDGQFVGQIVGDITIGEVDS